MLGSLAEGTTRVSGFLMGEDNLSTWKAFESMGVAIRQTGPDALEIRLDANGAWTLVEAREKMEQLAHSGIHSIEQPLAPGQLNDMAQLCRDSIIPVALDEELIGISDPAERSEPDVPGHGSRQHAC